MKETIKMCIKRIDLTILIAMTILIGIGVFCVSKAFAHEPTFMNTMLKQFLGIAIGYGIIVVIILIDYHFICNLAPIIYIGTVGLLGYTLLFGKEINYVKRWVDIGPVQIQPSELSKISIIISVTYLCSLLKEKMDKLYTIFILGAAVGVPMILILLEPHLSSTLSIIFIVIIMVFCSGIHYKVIGKTIAIFAPIIGAILISVLVFDVDLPFIQKYQVERVLSFLSDDESENLDGLYQQLQSISAISSGGLEGKFFTESNSNRYYSTIYAKESDFVFSIVGEEFGFIGSLLVILLFTILVFRSILIALGTQDYTGRLLVIGCASYLMYQIFVNIGVATHVLPNTGLPLPFISNGLTSLVSSAAAVGLILNVGIRQKGRLVS